MNSPYRAGTRKGGIDGQEFANETVFDRRIIRSPAKRNYRPYGTGTGRLQFAALGCSGGYIPLPMDPAGVNL